MNRRPLPAAQLTDVRELFASCGLCFGVVVCVAPSLLALCGLPLFVFGSATGWRRVSLSYRNRHAVAPALLELILIGGSTIIAGYALGTVGQSLLRS